MLVAGTAPPATLPFGRVVRTSKTQGYWRIHDRTRLPGLAATNLLLVDGDYVELAPVDPPVLTLIPTAMFGPPEKVWSDKTETTVPGLVVAPHGKGHAAYIPWDVGGLYYRHSSPAHAALMTDVIDQLLPAGRQLRTSAHPLVEMTLMTQPARGAHWCIWSTDRAITTRRTSRRSRCATSEWNCRGWSDGCRPSRWGGTCRSRRGTDGRR